MDRLITSRRVDLPKLLDQKFRTASLAKRGQNQYMSSFNAEAWCQFTNRKSATWLKVEVMPAMYCAEAETLEFASVVKSSDVIGGGGVRSLLSSVDVRTRLVRYSLVGGRNCG